MVRRILATIILSNCNFTEKFFHLFICFLSPPSGIYGVGKGALNKPAMVVLSHKPKDATETVAWVGKGIVYDTGGLSIKVRIDCCDFQGKNFQFIFIFCRQKLVCLE